MFPVDAAGAIVRKVVQEVTERVTNSTAQFKPTQATTDRPATVVTADQGGSTTTGPQTQPTYFLPQSFYSPVNLFVPIHRPDPGSQVPQQSPLKIDLTSKAAGQTTYEAKQGDTVESIAADHGLKPEDVLLTNPQYKSQPIKEGDKLFCSTTKPTPKWRSKGAT